MTSSPARAVSSATRKLSAIPVRSEGAAPASCDDSGLFALQVLGDSMLPEFEPGDIIVVEPDGSLRDGAFVVVRCGDTWVLRQLRGAEAAWTLATLAPDASDLSDLSDASAEAVGPLADRSLIRGVVIQKSKPGRRKTIKHYVD